MKDRSVLVPVDPDPAVTAMMIVPLSIGGLGSSHHIGAVFSVMLIGHSLAPIGRMVAHF